MNDVAPFRRFQIDRKAALVPVQREEGRVDRGLADAAGRHLPLPLAADRLDFDDVRPEIAQSLGRERPRHRHGAIEHSVA
ncbi:MAG: hypothetical protein ABSE69_13985 [Roseiarcus sp.]